MHSFGKTNILCTESVVKQYDNRLTVNNVSIKLEQGEAVGLFGPNGAGKTTFFNIVIGLIPPDSGKVKINDQDITNIPIYLRSKLGLAYLPQDSSIFKGLSVYDNIKAILEVTYEDKNVIIEKAEQLLDEFSISHLKNKLAGYLSGGERRRLEIARTLACNPKFIMLDEPLAGIDPIAINDIKILVSHLKDRNIGLLITDHNVRDTLDIVDRAYIFFDGRVLMEGKPDEVIGSDKVREVYLGRIFD